MELWQWHCRNRMEKKNCNWFVAMPLPKQGVKKKFFGNCGKSHCRKWEGKKEKKWFPKSEEIKKKKKCYVHNIFTINHM